MAELTPSERLQPSLLDRLTDEEREKKQESREKRVLSLQRLRECVIRDLSWLLNTGHLESLEDLDDYPVAARSVINYGLRDLAGKTVSNSDSEELERTLRQAIWDFEPRILRNTVKVQVLLSGEQMSHNTLQFVIEGELWAQPVPLKLFLKTDLDLESGAVRIEEGSGAS